jgi:hypothetical protein
VKKIRRTLKPASKVKTTLICFQLLKKWKHLRWKYDFRNDMSFEMLCRTSPAINYHSWSCGWKCWCSNKASHCLTLQGLGRSLWAILFTNVRIIHTRKQINFKSIRSSEPSSLYSVKFWRRETPRTSVWFKLKFIILNEQTFRLLGDSFQTSVIVSWPQCRSGF